VENQSIDGAKIEGSGNIEIHPSALCLIRGLEFRLALEVACSHGRIDLVCVGQIQTDVLQDGRLY
jgi:hypothetical protein